MSKNNNGQQVYIILFWKCFVISVSRGETIICFQANVSYLYVSNDKICIK